MVPRLELRKGGAGLGLRCPGGGKHRAAQRSRLLRCAPCMPAAPAGLNLVSAVSPRLQAAAADRTPLNKARPFRPSIQLHCGQTSRRFMTSLLPHRSAPQAPGLTAAPVLLKPCNKANTTVRVGCASRAEHIIRIREAPLCTHLQQPWLTVLLPTTTQA